MQRRLARVFACGLPVAACSFDSGGVGGPGTGLEDGDSTAAAESTGRATTGDVADATTLASADGGGSSSSSTTGDADTSSTTTTSMPSPCAIEHGGCDADATCEPDPSGEVAVCECNPGFDGNGVTCVVTPSLAILRAEAGCNTTLGDSCSTDDAHVEAMLVGEPGTVYVVTLWIRGVVELKSYDGGAPDGLWHPDGDPGNLDLWNSVTLSIAETAALPEQNIRLNSGSSGGSSLVLVDMTHDVLVEAGAVVGLTIDAIDGAQIRNHDSLVVRGIPPAPDAFDGQFVQIDPTVIVPM